MRESMLKAMKVFVLRLAPYIIALASVLSNVIPEVQDNPYLQLFHDVVNIVALNLGK